MLLKTLREGYMPTLAMREHIRRRTEGRLRELRTSRANLTHLIYAMEHDASLNAECTKITSLKQMLESIEHQLHTDDRYTRMV
jgi:hypothetical protein